MSFGFLSFLGVFLFLLLLFYFLGSILCFVFFFLFCGGFFFKFCFDFAVFVCLWFLGGWLVGVFGLVWLRFF